MDNKKYYVYAHIDPEGKVFYIGKGSGTRAYETVNRSKEWQDYVESRKNKGLPYSTVILHICNSEEDAFKLEEFEIALKLQLGQPLVNKASRKTPLEAFMRPIEAGGEKLTYEAVNLPRIFREIRKAKGITIEKLAAFSDISRDAVIKFEKGKTDMRLSNFLRMAAMCNVKILIQPNLRHCPHCQSLRVREKMNSYVCASCGKNWDRASAEYKNKNNK